jgi:hypothetical protein
MPKPIRICGPTVWTLVFAKRKGRPQITSQIAATFARDSPQEEGVSSEPRLLKSEISLPQGSCRRGRSGIRLGQEIHQLAFLGLRNTRPAAGAKPGAHCEAYTEPMVRDVQQALVD